ncbi:hypothetical protein GN244_ATG16361 [Phytophthora infestans]|uniref:Myb-like domain-containing protein n=1 Tax=Phytophthora infestans TaxID=4787 RepID=A0A833STI0_PHYIN|nr:hypothetical protein GN244_ATG16361 [Phytophthora infestans]
MLNTLRKNYVDKALVEMLVAAKKDPTTNTIATNLELLLLTRWLDEKKQPLSIAHWLSSDKSADGASGDAADDSAQKKGKKAFRFLPSSDVILLKEVIKHTPWAAGHGKTEASWGKVASGIKAALPLCTADGKACRRRFYTLIKIYKREELESLRASGTTEDYEEREQLLTDCFALTEGHAQQKAKLKKKN